MDSSPRPETSGWHSSSRESTCLVSRGLRVRCLLPALSGDADHCSSWKPGPCAQRPRGFAPRKVGRTWRPCRGRSNTGRVSAAQPVPVVLTARSWAGTVVDVPDGRYYDHHGYVRVCVGGKLVYEHRVVAAAALGRPLAPGEVVHHRNGIKDDNDPSNLEVKLWAAHSAHHAAARAALAPRPPYMCPACGNAFSPRPAHVRCAAAKGAVPCCSRRCANRYWRARASDTLPVQLATGHGTLSAYFRCPKPRCRPCKDAMRAYSAQRREKAWQALGLVTSQPRRAKLDEQTVRDLMQLWEAGGWSVSALARRFGVGRTTAWKIVHGRTWRSILAPSATS